jgi:hypothetical protein
MRALRGELEACDRDTLVGRARALGVTRPEVLTRPELVDEIVAATVTDERERRLARGLFGRARDLVARVVEKGLNLPEAANRLRTLAPPMSSWRRAPPPLATVGLAEVYLGQGLDEAARKVLDEVLAREPDHAYARALRDRCRGVGGAPPGPAPARPAARAEGGPLVSASEASTASDLERPPADPPRPRQPGPAVPVRDEVHATEHDGRVSVRWSVRPRSLARARLARPDGCVVLRLVRVEPSWQEPARRAEDVPIDALAGAREVRPLGGGATLCAAVGWRAAEAFEPWACSQPVPALTP